MPRKPASPANPSTPSKKELYAKLARDHKTKQAIPNQTQTQTHTTHNNNNKHPVILLDAPQKQDQAEIEELNAKIMALAAQLKKAENEINAVQTQADDRLDSIVNATRTEHQKEYDKLKSTLEEELKFARAAGAATAAEAEREKADATALRHDLNSCRLELAESRAASEAASAEAASLRASTEAARAEAEAGRAEEAAVRADLEAARAETSAARKMAAHAEAVSEELKASVEKMQIDLQRNFELREKELKESLEATLESERSENAHKLRESTKMSEKMTMEVSKLRSQLDTTRVEAIAAEKARQENSKYEDNARAVMEKRAFRAEARVEALTLDLNRERDKHAETLKELAECEAELREREEELQAAEEALSVLAPDAVELMRSSVEDEGEDADENVADAGENADADQDTGLLTKIEDGVPAAASVPEPSASASNGESKGRAASELRENELLVEKIANWAINSSSGETVLTNPSILAEAVYSRSEVAYHAGERIAREAPSTFASVLEYMNDWRGAIKDMSSDIGSVMKSGDRVEAGIPATVTHAEIVAKEQEEAVSA